MNVRVLYTTQLKIALGRASDEVELSAQATVGDAFNRLSQIHGNAFDKLARAADGSLSPSLLICIGDQCVGRDFAKALNPGDEITLLSPVSGG